MFRMDRSRLRSGDGFELQGRESDAPFRRPRHSAEVMAGADNGHLVGAVGADEGFHAEQPTEEQDSLSTVRLAWASYREREVDGALPSSSSGLVHTRSKVFSFRDASVARNRKVDIRSGTG